MTRVDYTIIAIYLVSLLIFGVFLAKRASQSSEHYFLGDRKLPWWALGASGMSSNLDIAGTMTLVTMLYWFGLHGFFIEMRGGVVLPIAIFMAFMGKWHRRSQVMTTAEWMQLRFGKDWQGKLARMSAAVTYLVITIGMVVFFLGAAGKFLSVFLPFTILQCQLLMLAIAFLYTVLSGIYGVVWTDVVQSVLIGGAALYVAIVGFSEVTPELLEQWPGATFNRVLPSLFQEELKINTSHGILDYRFFGLCLLVWASKGILEGLGGSGGSAYMAQRFYSAKNESDCLKIGMLWTILFAFRWPMVLGFAVLAISLGVGTKDPEVILPEVLLSEFFPSGVRGIIIAAMLAAAMSTFDSTINAGASYVVKDLYQPLKQSCTEKELVWVGYIASFFIVVTGLFITLNFDSIVGIWVAIVTNLFPAFLVPFALRWFWERFNGAGFTMGILTGFTASLLTFIFVSDEYLHEIHTVLIVASCSLLGSVLGTFMTPQTEEKIRKEFYNTTKPQGLWNKDWKQSDREEHRNNLQTMVVSLMWQISTFLIPMTIMLKMVAETLCLSILWCTASTYLWYQLKANDAKKVEQDP
ncbi:MAG: sodium:solute symporter [Verrucomicrobiota bacterium]